MRSLSTLGTRSSGLNRALQNRLAEAAPYARTRLQRGCALGGDSSSSSGADDAFFERALQEAADLVRRAQELAQQQARSELTQSWIADGGGGAGAASSSGNPSTAQQTEQQQQQQQQQQQPAASPEALAAFLQEQGLSRDRADRLAQTLLETDLGGSGSSESNERSGGGGGSGLSMAQLQARWMGLRRVLPDADLAEMVAREPRLLAASSGALVAAMVALVGAFPSRDVLGMVQGRPGLLLMQDLPERCERVVAKLMQLHPSKDNDVIAALIEENPELLVRMDYYMDARLLDELPVEIQNMMIPPGDMGIGWLYRHYSKKQ